MVLLAKCWSRFLSYIRFYSSSLGNNRSESVPKSTGFLFAPKTEVRIVAPHQLGWMRRADLDYGDVVVWEHPNGRLFGSPKGQPFRIAILDSPVYHQRVPDEETGRLRLDQRRIEKDPFTSP